MKSVQGPEYLWRAKGGNCPPVIAQQHGAMNTDRGGGLQTIASHPFLYFEQKTIPDIPFS